MIATSHRAKLALRSVSYGMVVVVVVAAFAELAFPEDVHARILRTSAVLLLIGSGFWIHALRTGARTSRELAARITLHRRAELELARSEERFRVAQAVSRVGTYDLDVAKGDSTWSESLRELYGVDADAPTGYEQFLALVDPRDVEHVRATVTQAWATGGDYEFEYRMQRPDGGIGWLLSRGSMFLDEDGQPLRAIGVAMDISDRKRADEEREKLEQQLRQAHRLEAVGRLAGGVAHDFNNLLLAIRGYGELAASRLDAGEDAREEVAEIVAVSDRAAALTKQLLAFSRQQILRPEVLDLNHVVADMTRLLRRMIGEDVELEALLGDHDVLVNADRGQLEQVIANLVVNGRDAMPDGGRLTLEVGSAFVGAEHAVDLPPGHFALLAVSDTGCGMSPDTVTQIFDPFFTTKSEGTGLGLATVHGIVQQSGGTIWVYSEPGDGTTFKIYLPLATAAAEVKPTLVDSSPTAGGTETILVVEDNPQVQTIVQRMLESRGYRVLTASDGEEALELISAETVPVDLLLSDLVLPRSSGREIAKSLRGLQPGIAVLYMSGYTDDGVVRRGILEEDTAFLQKPFSSEELATRVRTVLERAAAAA